MATERREARDGRLTAADTARFTTIVALLAIFSDAAVGHGLTWEDERVVAEPMNTRPKYVASRTLTEPLAWQNSSLLPGDVAEAVAGLKGEDGGDLLVMGSTQLTRTLMEHDLVDRLRLMIDPLVLGGGKRIFPEDGRARPLRLVDTRVTTTGAILATYAPADG